MSEEHSIEHKQLNVSVVESGTKPDSGFVACELDRHIKFDTKILESFSSTNWRPIVYDALVVAAVVEFCDRSLSRSVLNWGRRFNVIIPVHDRDRWSANSVEALVEALNLLTGDDWHFEFRSRQNNAEVPHQTRFEFPRFAEAIIAFSEGLDSRAVDGLERRRLGDRLVRVRVGSKRKDVPKGTSPHIPFAALPYEVSLDSNNAENSARSRGFKFSLVAGIAAYLVNANSVIVPESGQGALAPAILPVGQGYADYRNHPIFTKSMQRFISALFEYDLRYEFPRLWMTKGETLREYVDNCGPSASSWGSTRSCWQQSRQVSVLGVRRQCGICAACTLRRLSVHAAGLEELPKNYVWESLKARTFEQGAAEEFDQITPALREYALAGVLHFEHFALLRSSAQYNIIKRRACAEIALALDQPIDNVCSGLDRLLQKHSAEWSAFMKDLGPESFMRKWIDAA